MRVSILSSNGRLQLRFSYQNNRHYISLGLDDNPRNRTFAELKAKEIETDIIYDQFDKTLLKYKPNYLAKKTQDKLTLYNLAQKYLEQKQSLLAKTTINGYQSIIKILQELEVNGCSDSSSIKNFLLKNKSHDNASRIVGFIHSVFNWAIEEELIKENPLSKLKIKPIKKDKVVIPFTKEQRDNIINYYYNRYPYYAGIVHFCFYTGCRPSEAIALEWTDIKENFILFNKAVVLINGKKVRNQRLKTQSQRIFPITNVLKNIFEYQKQITNSVLIFPSKLDKELHWFSFYQNWKKVLNVLGIEYKNPYYMKHTFISMCLEQGVSPAIIATWCGTSIKMIEKHYGASQFNISPPDLT